MKTSLWALLSIPDYVWNSLFLFSVVLLIGFFFDDLDFGLFKIPKFNSEKRRVRLLSSLTLISLLLAARYPAIDNFDSRLSKNKIDPLDSKSEFSGFAKYDSEGNRIFNFSDPSLGELNISEGHLETLSQAIARAEWDDIDAKWPDLDETPKSALALAKFKFQNKEYYEAAELYSFAIERANLGTQDAFEISGLVTAGLYGSGQHRKGLLEICNRYKSDPNANSQYRHAVHAHVRAIALQESYYSAETVVKKLRGTYNCKFDDFSTSWIPIPLKFMEFLEKGQYYDISLDGIDKEYAVGIIEKREPFFDYVQLMLGGEDNFKDIVENRGSSFVYDVALLQLAYGSGVNGALHYITTYVRKFPTGKDVPALVLRSAEMVNSHDQLFLRKFEDAWAEQKDVLQRRDVVRLLLRKGPKPLALEIADYLIEAEETEYNTAIAIQLVVGEFLAGNSDYKDVNIIEMQGRLQRARMTEDLRSLHVLNYRKECTYLMAKFENMELGEVSIFFRQYHEIFTSLFGAISYQVKTSLDSDRFRIELPCAKSFGSSVAALNGSDFVSAIAFLSELQSALTESQDDTLSSASTALHLCHIKRLQGLSREDMGMCGALSRLLPKSTNFGMLASSLNMIIYEGNRPKHFKHLFLSAMEDRRDKKFDDYERKLLYFISRHSDTYLIDDVHAELGWYYMSIGRFQDSERHLRIVVDKYSDLNAFDNALYWLSKVLAKRGDPIGASESSAKLAAYLLKQKQSSNGEELRNSLRKRSPAD